MTKKINLPSNEEKHIIDNLIQFWFEEHDYKYWFGIVDKQEGDEFDKKTIKLMKNLHKKALKGELNHWLNTAKSCLALCLIYDQYPRNAFRNTPRAFATDYIALNISKITIAKGFDLEIPQSQRLFAYLPFMHSERLDDQANCIDLLKNSEIESGLKSAIDHLQIIAQFGRFPHRNKILGRPNTKAEDEYLKDPNAGF